MKVLDELLKNRNFTKFLVAIGLTGIILISFPSDSYKKAKSSHEEDYSREYVLETEKRLKSILENIEGVGKVKVMISLNSSEEVIYAQNEKISTDYTGNPDRKNEETRKESVRKEKNYVFSDYGSDRSALKISSTEPSVKGVIVVCRGGGNPLVKSRITEACSTILGIRYGNVFVAKSN